MMQLTRPITRRWLCFICLTVTILSVRLVDGATAPNCTIGVDLATPASVSSFECMVANGIQHATIRSFQSNCWLDPHAPQTIKNAWAAGLVVDTYIFPSVGCDLDPVAQVESTLNYLAANNASFNTLWIDVEDWGWDNRTNCQENQDAIRPMMSYAISQLGVERVGIYSLATMWNRIMCNTTEWDDTLLWYADWNGETNFDDFTPFGGWTAPFSKQWQDWGPGCLVDIDMDYRASGSCGYSAADLQALRQEQQEEAGADDPTPVTPGASYPAVPPPRPASVSPAGLNCTIGVDLATPVSTNAFQCLINNFGVQHLVVRSFQSNCYIDPHTVDTIHAAWAAGINGVDLYFFPSYGCSMDPLTQFDVTINHLASQNASFNRVFFDVEDWEWDPESQCADNVAWFKPLFDHGVDVLGIERIGIYSLKSMWTRITCDDPSFGDAQLWYAGWDNEPSFNGFVPFGGWSEPFEKQYIGNDFQCDIHLDFDYRASGQC